METLDLDTLADSEVTAADLAPENANEVYKQYDFTPKFDEKLPITRFKQQVRFCYFITFSKQPSHLKQTIKRWSLNAGCL